MSTEIDISDSDEKRKFINNFRKSFQSANVNFLFGSGCSSPFLPPLGNIEKQITDKFDNGKFDEANKLLFDFLSPFLEFMNAIKAKRHDLDFSKVLENYDMFINNIAKILFQRKNNILHKQISVFTTNYDLFFELAFHNYSESLVLYDGFKRIPVINSEIYFSISEYFNTVYNIGNIYKYQVEIPSINLIKLHGSLNWQIKNNKIINSIEYITEANSYLKSMKAKDILNFINLFTVILPRKDKFKETIINQIYYDLLRIFANELDKENTLLISEGFSFSDEHILEVVKRGLRNPTLKLIIFCYEINDLETLKEKFLAFNNVEIIYSSTDNISFDVFSKMLLDLLPLYLQDIEIKNIGTK
jgi:hypothetical protein